MTITIINDCCDQNAQARQVTRAATLLKCPVSFVGVASDLAAAGNLIDGLDAAEGRPGAVLINVAPRNAKGKKWGNGTPFGYFWYKETLVLSTIDGQALSLVKKLKLAQAIHVLDVPSAVESMIQVGALARELKNQIVNSQFRSYDFSPRVAAFLLSGGKVESKKCSLDEITDAPQAIWWIDNFGNCKTTLTIEDVGFTSGSTVEMRLGSLPCYARLKDVPDGQVALIIGSSGIEDQRFLEIVAQGGSAQKHFGLSSGDALFSL